MSTESDSASITPEEVKELVAAYKALQAENRVLKERVAAAETSIEEEVEKRLDNRDAERKADFDTRVAQGAVRLMAQVGQPTPAPSGGSMGDGLSNNLTGLDRTTAAFKLERLAKEEADATGIRSV